MSWLAGSQSLGQVLFSSVLPSFSPFPIQTPFQGISNSTSTKPNILFFSQAHLCWSTGFSCPRKEPGLTQRSISSTQGPSPMLIPHPSLFQVPRSLWTTSCSSPGHHLLHTRSKGFLRVPALLCESGDSPVLSFDGKAPPPQDSI